MQKELFEVTQKHGLARPAGAKTKLKRDQGQQIVFLELRRHHIGDDGDLRIEIGQQRLHESGLTGSDVAGDYDEAITLAETVLQKRKGAFVFLTRIEEARIRRKLERLSCKLEEIPCTSTLAPLGPVSVSVSVCDMV